MPNKKSANFNFISKIHFASKNECWFWKGRVDAAGYGRHEANGRTLNAHRVSYDLFIAPVTDDIEVHHTCTCKYCVNPFHLEGKSSSEHRKLQRLDKHCKRGHEFTELNTYWDERGYRICKACRRMAQIRRKVINVNKRS